MTKKEKGKMKMNKKALAICSILFLSVLAMIPITTGTVPREKELIEVSIGGPESVDPAWAYDVDSHTFCQHIYDPLIWFSRDLAADPTVGGSMVEFDPWLATDWWISEDNLNFIFRIRGTSGAHTMETLDFGQHWVETSPWAGTEWNLTSGIISVGQEIKLTRDAIIEGPGTVPKTVTQNFHVDAYRDEPPGTPSVMTATEIGVPWHDSDYGVMTAADVEYSFERVMVLDRSGGPAELFYGPLLDCSHANTTDPDWGAKIDAAVESNTSYVMLYCKRFYPAPAFLQILAQDWAAVTSKDWCISIGCWDGIIANWLDYYNPSVSPIDAANWPMMGTGPYKLDYWTHGVEWSVVWFEDFWQGWPAPGSDGYVERFTTKFIAEWSTRKMLFLAGDADFCYVPRPHIREVEGLPGIRCIMPCAAIHEQNIFWGFNVSTDSLYVGSDGWLASGTFSEFGQPPDLFMDIDVRKAFMYSFDYCSYLGEVMLGEAIQPASHHPMGLFFYNPSPSGTKGAYENGTVKWTPPVGTGPTPWEFDLAKAAEHFKTAYGGTVESPGPLWTNGFTIYMLYITGSAEGEAATTSLKEKVESLNDKFHIEPTPVTFGDFLTALFDRKCPLDQIGWTADYPDPHNFAHPYMHSEGTISWCHCFKNETVDAKIEAAAEEQDYETRKQMYYDLQWMFQENVINIPIYQAVGRHWERDWVKGWYYNALYPGPYAYHYWKEEPAEWGLVDISVKESISDVAGWLTADHDMATVKTHPDTGLMYPRPVPVDISAKRMDAPGGEHPASVLVYIFLLGNERGFNSSEPIRLFGQGDSWSYPFSWTEESLPPDVYNMTGRCAPSGAEDTDPANDWVYDGKVQVLGPCDGNGDNVMNLDDLLWLIEAFWATPTAANWDWRYDVDCDDVIGLDDLLWLIDYFWTIY